MMKLTRIKNEESDIRYQELAEEFKKFSDMLCEKYKLTPGEHINLSLSILINTFQSLEIDANEFRVIMDMVKHEYAKHELEKLRSAE